MGTRPGSTFRLAAWGLAGWLVMNSAAVQADTWLEAFQHRPIESETGGICTGTIGNLPEFEATPPTPGRHLVRVSLPFAPGSLPADLQVAVSTDTTRAVPDFRVLTTHPGQPASVRRGMVTFLHDFPDGQPQTFKLHLAERPQTAPVEPDPQRDGHSVRFPVPSGGFAELGPVSARLVDADGGVQWTAQLIAPPLAGAGALTGEVIEAGAHYLWVRALVPDTAWPRIVELRWDATGAVMLQAHLQRIAEADATAPAFGWDLDGLHPAAAVDHSFADGAPVRIAHADGMRYTAFPTAPYQRRGFAEAGPDGAIRYLRCTPDEEVPFQPYAWRRAAVAVGVPMHAAYTALLEPDVAVHIPTETYGAVYGSGAPPDLARWPVLDRLRAYTHDAIAASALEGDDWGNVTAYAHGGSTPRFGMNRLNHAPSIFTAAWQYGDPRLRATAIAWCNNMHDLSLWWAPGDTFGGTRYNNVQAMGRGDHAGDTEFMWRSNSAVHFCTKGYDSFLLAYEETGDPRMAAALRAQVAYAGAHVHADQGEARNVGDAADFMHLYRDTGLTGHRDEALRLFRELRTKLSDGNLFSQSGAPIVPDTPFIDDDQHGYDSPFAKPYIIGYALAGLPALLEVLPGEPKLRDVVRAVADFMAESQDPVGGWRYPHPRSSYLILSQGLEHAAQIARAAEALEARGEPIGPLVDAVERVLQQRVNGFARTGTILSGLTGWERSTGRVNDARSIYDLYEKATDRDPARDYSDGTIALGSAPPEGLVYFDEVLAFYLARRPAERLFNQGAELRAVLARTPDRRIRLIPGPEGSFVRMQRPEQPDAGFTLWAPEWLTFPELGYGPGELGGMAIDWQRDAESGALWYRIERDEAVFTAHFEPHVDYVACTYTVWPNPETVVPATWGLGPCQQMKDGVFESDEAALMDRMFFLSGGEWTAVGACANGNPRNVQYLEGLPSPDMTGAMAESGWRTIHAPRPSEPLMACISRDGHWISGTASEHAQTLCNNAGASHRCMHVQGSMPLRKDSPTVLRTIAYLMPTEGRDTADALAALEQRYRADHARWAATEAVPPAGVAESRTYGMRAHLPSFHEAALDRLSFPLARDPAHGDFAAWRVEARSAYLETLAAPPPAAPFNPQLVAVERRNGYEARKLALNISADDRVPAYLLVPDGEGPFPAIVALHDHGAHFTIGKEKVIRPFDVSDERLADATDWTARYYGGRWIGDALAERGYVVFAIDALFWGDRGRYEGPDYEAQQALAANMLQLGRSWAGTIVWDDVRSVEFVRSLPKVDPGRVGCVGLSMGANRTWHLTAATDGVVAGAAICWLGDTPTLMAEGNNQTVGQSAFSMIHPGLRTLLDYPHVAAIACPKPMLFYNGTEDGLFPVPGVEASYTTLRETWESQGAGDHLETRLWPVPHLFNRDMQDAAFTWLDRWLNPAP